MNRDMKDAECILIPAGSKPSGCLQTFGNCREGRKPVACSGVVDYVVRIV